MELFDLLSDDQFLWRIILSRDKIVPQPVLLASEKDIMLRDVYSKSFLTFRLLILFSQNLSSCKTSGQANKSIGESQDLPECIAEWRYLVISLEILPTTGYIEIIFPATRASDLADEERKLLSTLEMEVVRDSICLFGRKSTPL